MINKNYLYTDEDISYNLSFSDACVTEVTNKYSIHQWARACAWIRTNVPQGDTNVVKMPLASTIRDRAPAGVMKDFQEMDITVLVSISEEKV